MPSPNLSCIVKAVGSQGCYTFWIYPYGSSVAQCTARNQGLVGDGLWLEKCVLVPNSSLLSHLPGCHGRVPVPLLSCFCRGASRPRTEFVCRNKLSSFKLQMCSNTSQWQECGQDMSAEPLLGISTWTLRLTDMLNLLQDWCQICHRVGNQV